MGDILIHGMEMPKKQVYVILNTNGLVEVLDENNVLLEEYQSVPVPPHRRLIDADALLKEVYRIYDQYDAGIISEIICMNSLALAIRNAPAIIAEED